MTITIIIVILLIIIIISEIVCLNIVHLNTPYQRTMGSLGKSVLKFLFVILSHIYFSQSPGVGDVALTIHI